jgi:hypothetical protein
MEHTMKSTLFSIAAAITLLGASALAQAQDSSVQVRASDTPKTAHRYYMQPYEFSDYRGLYQLTNGQRIAFRERMNRFYATLGDGEPVRIFPTSRNTFLTAEGAHIEFRDEGDTVAIANYERLPMAGNLPANTIIMAKR